MTTTLHPYHRWTQPKIRSVKKEPDAPSGPPWRYRLTTTCLNCKFTIRADISVGDGPWGNEMIWHPLRGNPVPLGSVRVPTVCRSVDGSLAPATDSAATDSETVR